MYTLIVRTGCHLCDQAEESLRQLEAELKISWRARNIDSDPSLAQYSDDLPVLLKEDRVVARLTSSKPALEKAVKPTLWQRIKDSL